MTSQDASQPLVSVVMPVYNASAYVLDAFQSILAQTFEDFEFIIIDNGSTDGSRGLLEARDDSRVRIVMNPTNVGPPPALNQGLRLARGEYVARMDADDVAFPDRLGQQVRFLAAHRSCAVVGTQRGIIDHAGRRRVALPLPTAEVDLRWRLLFTSPLAHSSVMMRRDVILGLGGYDEGLRHAADYQLWSSVVGAGYQIANLPGEHMLIRVHQGADGLPGDRAQLLGEVARVSHANLRAWLGMDVPIDAVRKVVRLLDPYDHCPPEDVAEALRLFRKIAAAFGHPSRFYGRTLLRLGLAAGEIPALQRLALTLEGTWVSASAGMSALRGVR